MASFPAFVPIVASMWPAGLTLSPRLYPLLFLALAALQVWITYNDIRSGEASLPRGVGTYRRDEQPVMFWLATGMSGVFAAMMLFAAFMVALDDVSTRYNKCLDPRDKGNLQYYVEFAAACTTTLEGHFLRQDDRRLAYDNRGFVFFRLKQYQRAMEDFSESIRLSSSNAWAYYMRGLAYRQIGKPQPALQDFNAALKLKPDDKDARRERDGAYIDTGKAATAIEDLSRLAALTPKDALVYFYLGTAYQRQGDCVRALQYLDKALVLNPAEVVTYTKKSECQDRAGTRPEAIATLDEALRRAPGDFTLLFRRADANFQLERYDEAIEDVSQMLLRAPANAAFLNKRCWFEALSNRNIAAAVRDCDESINLAPKILSFRETRVLALYRAERYATAVADCDSILSQHPGSMTALYLRGLARRQLGDPRGDDDLTAAQDKSPGDVKALSDFGFRP